MKKNILIIALSLTIAACSKDSSQGGGSSYTFTSPISTLLTSSTLGTFLQTSKVKIQTLPNSCTDNLCYTPTAMTGKYYAVGLLIQSTGNGMMSYFGDETVWSDITGTSTTYDFNFASPVTQTGNLTCCSGTGDLTHENTYFSNVVYLFAYLDVTFTGSASDNLSGTALGAHTIRFIMADDAVTGGKRGDLMYSDSGTFKWMDTSGNLSTTRPTSPITMNASVTNWTNPFGTEGNQTIPSIGTNINSPASGGVNTTSETELKIANRTYSFDFDASGIVFFPTTLRADAAAISSRQALMERVHLQGLPHSGYGDGTASAAGNSTLTITN